MVMQIVGLDARRDVSYRVDLICVTGLVELAAIAATAFLRALRAIMMPALVMLI